MTVRTCRGCGCTNARACVTAGVACHWVSADLCSACEHHWTTIGEAIEKHSQATVSRVCEYDDRTPPDGFEAYLLITPEEFDAELKEFAANVLGLPDYEALANELARPASDLRIFD